MTVFMQAGEKTQSLRFAYSTINWGATCDIPAALQEIRSAGWRAVELFGHSLDVLGTPASLSRQLDGLVPATLFSAVELPVSDLQRTTLMNHVRFASEIGADALGLVGGARLRWRPPTSAEVTELASFCEELAVFGSDCGVDVSYHPHVGCTIETSVEIEQLLAESSALRLCLDASHIALVGEDPLTVIDRYWERLGYIHLKDWGHGKFQELGRGTLGIDFEAILTMLVQREFPGWVVLEQSQSDRSPHQSASVNAAFLGGLGYALG